MLELALTGWKAETIGDDICWMRFGADSRLMAINSEAGFFGVASGTGPKAHANALAAMRENTIFPNTALTANGDVWWEGLTRDPPANVTDWRDRAWSAESGGPAHAPMPGRGVDDPNGMPISAILFGGRRATTF